MPRGSYVGDALLGLRVLGGLLAQPSLQATAENQQSEQNKLLAIAQGKDPVDVPDVSPAWYSPNQGGITGGILSGVGGLGQLMATLGGMPIRAPRPDLGEQVAALQLGQKAKENAATTSTLDELFKGDTEGRAYATIDPKAALKKKFGMGDGSPSVNRWIELVNNPDTPESVRTVAQRNLDTWASTQARAAGGRAYATLPAQLSAGAANDARDAATRERERGTREQQGRDFIAPYLDGSVGRFERQGGRPTLLDGTPGQLRPAGFEPVADERPAPSGLVPTSGSYSSGTGTVSFGLPEKVTADTEILARSLGLDLRNLSQQDAQLLLTKQRDLDANRRQREEEVKRQNATLNDNDRQVVAGMFVVHDLLRKTQTDFTPEERTRYVGLLNQPLAQVKQLMRNDPRFAEWGALLGQIQAAKFDFAGKNLTKTENDIINSFIPTGSEYGGQGEFDKKVGRYLEQIPVAIQAKLTTAGPISAVQERVDQMQSDSNPKAQFDSLLQQYGY